MDKKTPVADKIVKVNHTKRGKFAPGNCANPHGRPPVPEIAELRAALKKIAEQTGVPFFELFVGMAYKHKEVAIALAKKLIPDKIQGEGFGGLTQTFVYLDPRAMKEHNDRVARADGDRPAENNIAELSTNKV